MSDTRPPLVSDELLAMHAARAESDWDLACRIRVEYESLITSGHLRRVGVCKVRLDNDDPDFPTFPVCTCNGRGPVSPDEVWCPYCGNKTEWG